MVGDARIDGGPRSVIVVGAGIVGLSTAWFLQERGVEVTVVDRTGVAAGASWGNAGWIAPGLTAPLNQPAVLRYGLRSLLNPAAPLSVPLPPEPGLARFLLQFALNCRPSIAERVIRANQPFNDECLEAFDVLAGNGVDAPITDTSIVALFATGRQAEGLCDDLRMLRSAGQHLDFTLLDGRDLADYVPLAGPSVSVGVAVEGQRYVDPGRFVTALGRAVTKRGARIHTMGVREVTPRHDRVEVLDTEGSVITADAVVIATGAWLNKLAHKWIRQPVRAGRGYSFTVPVNRPVPFPIYLPTVRVACTPYHGQLRVAGTMEFTDPDEPLRQARVDAIAESARTLLDGVCWHERRDLWVGPRPVSADGRPLVGEAAPGVYVAGGHGMWGLAHGPITGRMLAEQITTGKQPEALREFDPLR